MTPQRLHLFSTWIRNDPTIKCSCCVCRTHKLTLYLRGSGCLSRLFFFFRVPEPEAPSSLGNVTERVQAQWCARRCTDGLWKSRKLDSFQFIRTILCTGRTEAQMGALPSKCGQPPSQQPLGNLSGMNPQGGREAPQSDSELTAEEMKAARTRADWHPVCLTVTHLVPVYSWTHLFISFSLEE